MINLLTNICKNISSYGGIFIIIDYARNKSNINSTLASIKLHKKVDIFHDIGNCDISYMPDFELIKKKYVLIINVKLLDHIHSRFFCKLWYK